MLGLGPELGPVLWQLPENLRFDADVLDAFLAGLPRTTAEAAELATRHDDKVPDDRALTRPRTTGRCATRWSSAARRSPTPRRYDVLRRHGVACVLADTAGRWPRVDEDTGAFRYVRLHGDKELYASGYTDAALDDWAARCRGWAATGRTCSSTSTTT